MSAGGSDSAALALQCFNRGDYAACQRHLNCLTPEPRVEHNRALAELLASDTRGSERYRRVLARALGATFPRADLPPAALRRPTLVYNYAVLLYHARYYRQAAEVLERLFTERVKDAALARRVALLLGETSLCRRNARRALEAAEAARAGAVGDEAALCSRVAARALLMMGARPETPVAEDSVEGVILAAHARYLAGDAVGAAETLARHASVVHDYTARTQGEDVWAALNNNLGVLHLALNKPALATKYFQVAVKEHARALEGPAGERLVALRDRPLHVYNLGLALLRAARPAPAFECLLEAARHFPSNPRVWHRLADCCVRHAAPLAAATAPPTLTKLGSGAHVRLTITDTDAQQYSTSGESFAIPSLTLEFAALCLRNALTLLAPRSSDEPLQAPPGAPLDEQQARRLRNAVLILNSYVLLRLQDPLAALNSATELLRSDASEGPRALAHVYAAEALISLDRIAEATEHLNPPVIHELVSALPAAAQDALGVQVWATAAVCHVLRGDLLTARKILAQINSPRVLPLQIYLESCAGGRDACHAILRKMRCLNM